ncbi:TPA: GTPase ObgE, partial [Vibrio cholerae]|nr:GTPase ObgE [Vibrio cholerae]
ANRQGTKELCMKLAEFMDTLPREAEEKTEAEKVDFTWDYNHKDGLAGREVITEDDDDWDDWDDEEDDGHVIYVRD